MLYFYEICRHMEYCYHIWAAAPACHLSLIDRPHKHIVKLDGTEKGPILQPFSPRRSEATLSLFNRYFHDTCSVGLSNLVHPVRVFGCKIQLVISAHLYMIADPKCDLWPFSTPKIR